MCNLDFAVFLTFIDPKVLTQMYGYYFLKDQIAFLHNKRQKKKKYALSELIDLKIELALSCSHNILLTGTSTDLLTIHCINNFRMNVFTLLRQQKS